MLQDGFERASLKDYRLGQILDALFAANLNGGFGAVALKALEVYAIPTPWLHQETTTIVLYGASEDAPKTPEAPRPASGHSKDGRDDFKQVLLSLGVSGDGGLPVRVGLRDGHTSESTETPVASEEGLALGLNGGSRTLILRIIPVASTPGKMSPFHTDVRGCCHGVASFFLPTRTDRTRMAVCHAPVCLAA